MIQTPYLDEIEISKWFNANYNPQQTKEVDNLIQNHIWITGTKVKIPVKRMSTSHIKNCIHCWHGRGKLKIPAGYLGGKDKWLKIFDNELLQRQ